MVRLIDGDSFEAGIKILFGESNPIIHIVINKLHDQPTVEAIPKADYEARLKADMMAMLTEIQLEMKEEIRDTSHLHYDDLENTEHWNSGINSCVDTIQQKIDALKAESEDKK